MIQENLTGPMRFRFFRLADLICELRFRDRQPVDVGYPTFHHHFDPFLVADDADVLQRVAVHDQEVGVFALADGAEVLLFADALRCPACGGLDGLHVGETPFDHQLDLPGVVAVDEPAGIGARGKGCGTGGIKFLSRSFQLIGERTNHGGRTILLGKQ